jgi:ABC-type antimicrobial peptide transport system permease subunit
VDHRQFVEFFDPDFAGYFAGYSFGSGLANPAHLNTFIVRSEGDPQSAIDAIARTIVDYDSSLSIQQAATMPALISRAIGAAGQNWFLLIFSVTFGALSLVLAAVGLYGMMSHGVSRRRHEIGVRMAIGAEPATIMRAVLARGLRLTFTGLGLGLLGAWAGSRVLESALFGVSPTDAWTFLGVAVFLTFVSVMAISFPAYRASCVDPLIATRAE